MFIFKTYIWFRPQSNNEDVKNSRGYIRVYTDARAHARTHARTHEGKSKSKGIFHKKNHIYCKYTETKLISLFSVNPLDFNAPVPAFHNFLIPSEKKSSLVAPLTNFAPRQFLKPIVSADEI
jgi:hypothetical protein